MHSSRLHFLMKLGRTPDAALHGERMRTVRPGEGGISAGIDTEHPGSSSGGQMKRSGIIGDDKVGFAGEGGELEQPGASAKIQHGQRRHQSNSVSTMKRSSREPTTINPAPNSETARARLRRSSRAASVWSATAHRS